MASETQRDDAIDQMNHIAKLEAAIERLKLSLIDKLDCLEAEHIVQDRQQAEIERLQNLLACRAGKLLQKGKPFIVVANDETYFSAVYLVIREAEEAKGKWTEECERVFQELTHHDDRCYFPVPSPELQGVLREYVEKNKMKHEIERLQVTLKNATDWLKKIQRQS